MGIRGGVAWALAAGSAWSMPAPARDSAAAWEALAVPDGLPAARALRPRLPRQDRGWVLLLHGWGQHARDWEGLSEVERLAEGGWTLVAPDMGRSVYSRAAAVGNAEEPGYARVVALVDWVVDSLGLAAAPAARAVVGVSTGGRGAAILGMEGRFGTVIALSGTYDLRDLAVGTGEYRIHAAVFGERARDPARWEAEDVPRAGAGGRVRWFLGHALADPFVPVAQTEVFARRLSALAGDGAGPRVRLVPGGGHDWRSWNEAIGWARSQGAW